MILPPREMLAASRNEDKPHALEIERLKLQLAKARNERLGNHRSAEGCSSNNSNS